MNIFDIIGPVMVGPSSSHTAGAARIGRVARQLLGEKPVKAVVSFHGSFEKTYVGHGTDRAVAGGLMDMGVDDERLRTSKRLAQERGMTYEISTVQLRDAHPNSVLLRLTGASGREMEIVGESLGGSVINIRSIGGMEANFSGEAPTLILCYRDKPGFVSGVTSMLALQGVNIAAMHVSRTNRGGAAAMVIECDQEIPAGTVPALSAVGGVERVLYYSPKEETT